MLGYRVRDLTECRLPGSLVSIAALAGAGVRVTNTAYAREAKLVESRMVNPRCKKRTKMISPMCIYG